MFKFKATPMVEFYEIWLPMLSVLMWGWGVIAVIVTAAFLFPLMFFVISLISGDQLSPLPVLMTFGFAALFWCVFGMFRIFFLRVKSGLKQHKNSPSPGG